MDDRSNFHWFNKWILANGNASGGEQKLFTYIAYSIAIALIGVFLINVGTLIFFPAPTIKRRVLSICLIVVSLILLYPLFKGIVASQYDSVEKQDISTRMKLILKWSIIQVMIHQELSGVRAFGKMGRRIAYGQSIREMEM